METRTYAGHIYQRANPGDPWTLAGPAPRVLQAPNQDLQRPKLQGEIDNSAESRQHTALENARLKAQAAYDARNAAAAATKAEADASMAKNKAEDDALAHGVGVDPKVSSDKHGQAYFDANKIPPQRQALIRSLVQGNLPAGQRSIASKTMLPYIQDAVNFDPSFSTTTFQQRSDFFKNTISGKDGAAVDAAGTAMGHAFALRNALGDLNNHNGILGAADGIGNFINKNILRTTGPGTADSELDKFSKENAAAYGNSTGAERANSKGEVDLNGSPEQQYTIIKNDVQFYGSKLAQFETKAKRVLGDSFDINNYLSPEAKQAREFYRTLDTHNINPDGTHAGDKPLPSAMASEGPDHPGTFGAYGLNGGGTPPGGGNPPSGGGTPYNPLSPITSGPTKADRNPEREKALDAALRSGAPLSSINAISHAMGGIDIPESEYTRMKTAVDKGYTGPTFDTTAEVPTSLLNRVAGSDAGVGVGAGIDAAMGGTSDELGGAIQSIINGRPIADNVAELNAAKQAAFRNSPKSAFTGQAIGSVAALFGAGKLLKGVPAVAGLANPTLAADLGFGALSGAGQDNDNRLRGAALGAAGAAAGNTVGAVLAKPLGALARTDIGTQGVNVARGLLSKLPGVDPLLPIAKGSAISAAQQGILSTAEQAGVPGIMSTLDDAASRKIPFSLADTSPMLGEEAGSATRHSPVARSLAEGILNQRSQGQIGRLGDTVRRELGPIGNTTELSAALSQKAKTDAGPLYDAAYAVPGRTSPELESLLDTPFGRQSLGKAQTIAANERADPNKMGFGLNDQGETVLNSVPSMQTIDYAKRGMDDVLEQYRNPLTNRLELSDAGRAQNLVKNQLLREADNLVPEYGAARQAYQGPMESLDALHRGQDFHGSSVDANQIAANLADQNPEHIAQMQLGYRDQMMAKANNLQYSTNPWRTLNSPGAEDKLSAMYPDSAGPANLIAARDAEMQMASTQNRVIGGSPTAQRQIADQQYLPDAGQAALTDIASAGITGGVPVTSIARLLAKKTFGDAAKARAEQQATQMAEESLPMLLNTDPTASKTILQNLIDKQAAYQAWKAQMTPSSSMGMAGAGIGLAADLSRRQ